ncbi:hypothetical protein ACQJBY_067302 [Aegilops geniculata]
MSQQQARQPNTTSVQASSLTNIGQNLPGVNQTSTMQNVSVMPQNTMNNGLAQGTSQDIYAAQRQMAGRQQLQQSQQLIYQQQQMLMKQKLQQNSLMQPHIQQQQSLLQPTQMQSTQKSMMPMSSGLHPVQSTVPQTQPMSRQSVTQSGIQQNQLNSVQQSVPSLLQQPQQSVGRQQQQAQPSMHQQPSLQRQQPNIPLQQQQQQQQQLMGQQPNLERNQLIGQQNSAVEMQQQQRLPAHSNNLLNVQQTQQQMLNQQSMPLHQPQQLGSQANMSSLQQQQQNQQQQRMHMLQMKAQQTQQQQHAQQSPMGLMQPQSQHNQLQQSQQHLMSQFQSQPNQLQQQLGMQQQSSMQQRLQTSGGMLLQQNNMDQQKQFIQAQRGLQEVSSSTSADSTTQTGLAGAGDWQEEIYQMIKSLKDQHFAELSDLSNKISMKLQHVDSIIPPQKPSEQYDKMKNFKNMLDRILQLLQISKSTIQPAMRDKIPQYEKQIISILSSQRRKPVQPQMQQQFQPPAGQASNSSILQQQQTSQNLQQHDSHTNPQASLSSMSTGLQSSGVAGMQHVPVPPTTNFSAPTQQNGANIQHQAVSNLEAAQGGNLNSLQHGSVSGALQQGNTGLMQGTMNTQQLQTSSGMLSHNSMSTMQPNGNSMQANVSSLQQLKQQQQDHHMMQSQQMKRQMFQQYQQKQQMLQQQFPMQQQSQKQQQVQMQVPQLHAGNDVNESKARPGTAVKPGIYQQHLGQRSNYYHQQLKQGGAFPISSPQNLQASSPQISHHSPQVDQHNLLPSQVKTGTPLNSANSPYVPSPSPSVAPSPIPVDSDKPHSNISSLTTGQTGHQQTSLAPQTQSIAVNTPGISASPLLAEFTSVDGSQGNMPTQAATKSNAAERPMDRLLKALRTTQRESLNAAVSDIRSVVSMMDRIAGSAPGNGSRTAVGEDLVAMTKCRLQARNFITNDGSGASKKMKRDVSAMPLNVSSAGSVDDSFKQTFSVDTPDLQSTATSRAKRRKIEVNHALLEEIEEINQGLIDTELCVCEDDDESLAAASEGTVIKCTYTAVAVSPSLKSMLASAQTSPIMPLRLLVPAGYPKCSPVLLDKFLDEQRNSDDLSSKAKSKFGVMLRGLDEPMSLREIARTWDACARGAIAEYAQKSGGGSFSSSYGRWETCVV